ncbi:zinc finger MYM-type protein 5-like isoform X2 [Entelurus aequoreus]|uniref:zinc finger MYM-type protein 5-like isoform X2 n=1 Tax=Entelurus aequoreus TaxID=161455 RepID=UPI002B1D0FA2|nr:zinc finger MYM-type protein 5-like isoform X2 [Entelurus aequoreus]
MIKCMYFILGPSPSSTVLSHTPPSSVPTVPSMSETTADLSTTSTTMSPSHHGPSSALPVDPAEWPSFLSDSDRTEQVIRGPLSIKENFSFPKRHDGRSFHYHYTYRQLVNGEKVKRSWLTYSRCKDAVYCFCCKLFSKKSLKLAAEGQRDWVNIGALLKLLWNTRCLPLPPLRQHLETPLRAKQDTPPRSLRRPRPRADTAGDNPLSTHLGLMRGSRIKRLAADF